MDFRAGAIPGGDVLLRGRRGRTLAVWRWDRRISSPGAAASNFPGVLADEGAGAVGPAPPLSRPSPRFSLRSGGEEVKGGGSSGVAINCGFGVVAAGSRVCALWRALRPG